MFGEVEAETAGEVLRNWDRSSASEPGREPGVFGEVPENLPGPAVRAQGPAPGRLERVRLPRRRGAAAGRSATSSTSSSGAGTDDERFHELGDVLFAAVNVARKLRRRPRAGAARAPPTGSGTRVQAGVELAASEGAKLERSRS